MTNTDFDPSLIREILPHREPFLFVDSIVSFQAGDRITALHRISGEACFLKGHFPGKPVMPGVLVTEALAQTSGLLLGLSGRNACAAARPAGPQYVLTQVDMKYISPAGPEDTLRLDSAVKKTFGRLTLFSVAAHVGERAIARGTLSLGMVDAAG